MGLEDFPFCIFKNNQTNTKTKDILSAKGGTGPFIDSLEMFGESVYGWKQSPPPARLEPGVGHSNRAVS